MTTYEILQRDYHELERENARLREALEKWEPSRNTKKVSMRDDDTPLTRVDYLLESIDDVSETCSKRGYIGACSMLDNLHRIASDVKLSILRSVKEQETPSNSSQEKFGVTVNRILNADEHQSS